MPFDSFAAPVSLSLSLSLSHVPVLSSRFIKTDKWMSSGILQFSRFPLPDFISANVSAGFSRGSANKQGKSELISYWQFYKKWPTMFDCQRAAARDAINYCILQMASAFRNVWTRRIDLLTSSRREKLRYEGFSNAGRKERLVFLNSWR